MAKDIGALIKEMRIAAGMSQMKLADKMGLSYQQIQKYEKCGNKIGVPRLITIAEIFGVPVISFLQDDPLDSDSSKNVAQCAIKDDELILLSLFRRVPFKKQKTIAIEMVRNLVKMLEGK